MKIVCEIHQGINNKQHLTTHFLRYWCTSVKTVEQDGENGDLVSPHACACACVGLSARTMEQW